MQMITRVIPAITLYPTSRHHHSSPFAHLNVVPSKISAVLLIMCNNVETPNSDIRSGPRIWPKNGEIRLENNLFHFQWPFSVIYVTFQLSPLSVEIVTHYWRNCLAGHPFCPFPSFTPPQNKCVTVPLHHPTTRTSPVVTLARGHCWWWCEIIIWWSNNDLILSIHLSPLLYVFTLS